MAIQNPDTDHTDLYFDLHEIYWDKVWPLIQYYKLDGKNVPKWIAEQLDIKFDMSKNGNLIMSWSDYDHELQTDFVLSEYIALEIKMRQAPTKLIDKESLQELAEWKKTLQECVDLIDDALKSGVQKC